MLSMPHIEEKKEEVICLLFSTEDLAFIWERYCRVAILA